jgi:hypothetical protein
MAKKLNFKDFMAVDYMPGEDDLIKQAAKKRKQYTPTGNTGEAVEATKCKMCGCDINNPDPNCDCDHDHTTEALTMMQRRAKSRSMKKYQARLKVGRKKAAAKVANPKVLAKRARKAARNAIAKKMTKGISKADLTPARKAEIEKRLDKMAPRITRLAKKMLPKIRQTELGRKRG